MCDRGSVFITRYIFIVLALGYDMYWSQKSRQWNSCTVTSTRLKNSILDKFQLLVFGKKEQVSCVDKEKRWGPAGKLLELCGITHVNVAAACDLELLASEADRHQTRLVVSVKVRRRHLFHREAENQPKPWFIFPITTMVELFQSQPWLNFSITTTVVARTENTHWSVHMVNLSSTCGSRGTLGGRVPLPLPQNVSISCNFKAI